MARMATPTTRSQDHIARPDFRMLRCSGGLTLLCVASLGCRSQPGPVASVEPPRPNIVYILADDMGYGDVSALNAQCAWTTESIDRLANEGVSFADAHTGSAVCTPTRYGILTGRYAWRSRLAKGVLNGQSPPLIDAGRVTVGSWLQGQGYETACFGKWHLGWNWSRTDGEIDFDGPVTQGPHASGFDETFCHSGSLDMQPYVWVQNGAVTAPPNRVTENKDYQGFWRKGPTGSDFDHEDVLPELTRRSVAYIKGRSAAPEPFFLYLPLAAPHTPILPTLEFQGASGTNAYGDFVLQVDDCVGQVMAALEEAGLSEDTLVIFTCDNGCSPRARFEELATFGHDPSAGYRGHKADIFEGGHRVPFIARWPSAIRQGATSNTTICSTDLFSTCADILDVPLPDHAAPDSVSFLNELQGQPATQLRDAVIHHSINGSFAVRKGQWKLIMCPGSGGWSQPTPKVAREADLPSWQLYDLDADPAETVNLAETQPEICADLALILEGYIAEGRSTPGPRQSNDREIALPKR